MSSTPSYDEVASTYGRLHRLSHLGSIAGWDQAAWMPPKGMQARADALAELAGLLHRLRTAPELARCIEQAAQEPLSEVQRANLREIQRDWAISNALPEALVQQLQQARSRCEHGWRTQRPANDWAGFLINFRPVLDLTRQSARLLAERSGRTPYDALLDQYEPGMTSAMLDRIFGQVRQWLPDVIERVVQRQAAQQAKAPVLLPTGPFALERQRWLCEQAMRLLGFDFEAGRLDVSAHPFCGGVPEDVRMTTRFRDDDFLGSLLGTMHETGHGRYEQNLPRQWLGQPIANSRSMALHESQSLSFEMQLASHPGFAKLLAPLVCEAFGPQPAFEPENLHRLMTRVQRGLIRVDADEVTYAAHVILRYEIERPLVEGSIEAEDIPALWDAKMAELLRLDTRGNFKDGPLQDVHWPDGLIGYFPCYSLGAMYAAQWFATMRRQMPELDQRIERGELAPVFAWLQTHIWSQGSRWTTEELALRASGEALNPAHFKAHLERRYLG
jgi:carboxypeptidase Taq